MTKALKIIHIYFRHPIIINIHFQHLPLLNSCGLSNGVPMLLKSFSLTTITGSEKIYIFKIKNFFFTALNL